MALPGWGSVSSTGFLRKASAPTATTNPIGWDQPHRLAARLAGKEAVAKALGTGIGDVSWREIEIRCGERGRPVLHLHGAAVTVANELGLTEWDISLTHTETQSAAMVVAR